MKTKRIIFLLLFLAVVLNAATVEAQSRRNIRSRHIKGWKKVKHYELLTLYGGLELPQYYGDLCEKMSCVKPMLGFGFGAYYRLLPFEERLFIKAELNFFRLNNKVDFHNDRNLSFRSNNIELQVAGMINLFPHERVRSRRRTYEPYFFLGLGLLYFEPYVEVNGQWYKARDLQTEGKSYSNLTMAIPFGIGTQINISPNWNMMLGAGYRYTFTDYLDDVSGPNYTDPNSFSNPIAAEASYKGDPNRALNTQTRGNPKNNDGYFLFSIRVAYTFTDVQIAKFRGKRNILRK